MRAIALAAMPAALLCLLAAQGCSHPAPPPEAEPDPAPEVMTMSGVDLYLHKAGPTQGRMENPTFWVHAEHYELTGEEDDVHAFREARAVVYGDAQNEKVIVFTAERGRMVEGQSAYLSGTVVAQMGNMTMHLADVHWENPDATEEGGLAYSEAPLTVTSPALDLRASSLRVHPETREFELTDVTGIVHFGRNTS